MKRLTLVLVALALFATAQLAAAQNLVAPHYANKQILFRTTISQTRTNGGFVLVPSISLPAGAVACTTQAISTQGWIPLPAAYDSSAIGRLIFSYTGTCGCDTPLTTTHQVSADGSHWLTVLARYNVTPGDTLGKSIASWIGRGLTLVPAAVTETNAVGNGGAERLWPFFRVIAQFDPNVVVARTITATLSGYSAFNALGK
jgi:hypothetical protein